MGSDQQAESGKSDTRFMHEQQAIIKSKVFHCKQYINHTSGFGCHTNMDGFPVGRTEG